MGLFFDVEGGGLPMMEVDRGASDEGRLVFVRGPRRSCGVVVGVLGAAAFVGAVVLAVLGGDSRGGAALLALGGFVAAAGAASGVVLATNRSRFIVDRTAGQLISSWWFLGIENRTTRPIGDHRSVGWCREVEHSGGGNEQHPGASPVPGPARLGGRRDASGASAVRGVS